MVRMKALTSFGYAGVNEGPVKRGREFVVQTDRRANDLEEAGLAYRVEVKKLDEPTNKMQPPPENKAEQKGPLPSAGGKTGEVKVQRSSHQDHQPEKPVAASHTSRRRSSKSSRSKRT